MASAVKRKQRSSRSHQVNSIPANMFYNYAEKVRQAKAVRNFYSKMAEEVTEKVEAEVVE